jgi:hypothetical protein
VEDMDASNAELPEWQKDALDKELQAIAKNPDYTIQWDNVKNRFKQNLISQ